MRKYLRITFYIAVTALFVVVAVLGFTQTRYFRAYLREVILASYPEYVNATIQFEKLEGNLITRARLYNVAITKDSTRLFSAERIEARYNPAGLLLGRVLLANISLINPEIHVWRSVDGSWNLDGIVKPRSDTTGSKTVVEIRNAEFKNARILFVDSLVLQARRSGKDSLPPPGAIDYASMSLESVQFEGGARIDPEVIFVAVRKLSFESRKPRFKLARVTGDFTLSPTLASVSNLLVQTRNSTLKLEAQVKDLDVRKVKRLEDLERAPVKIVLEADQLDAREVKQVLYPHVDFLDKMFSLDLKAEGTLRTLGVDAATIRTARSFLQVRGTISNLHAPEKLQLELASIGNKLSFADLEDFAPGLHLPSLLFLGEARYNVVFNGSPDNFVVNLTGATDAGEVELDGSMRFEKTPAYKFTLAAKNIDLGVISQDDKLRSQIKARITVNGAGTNIQTISAVCRVEIDSSSISDIPVDRSITVLDVSERVARLHTTTNVGAANYDISGRLQFRNDSTSFLLNGKVGSLDLGQILKNAEYESDLTFQLAANGSWLDRERIRADAELRFLRSSFNKESFDSAGANVRYDTRDTARQGFALKSSVADFDVEGKFNAGSFLSNVVAAAEIIGKAIAHRAHSLDSLRAFVPFQISNVPKFLAAEATKEDSVNASFTATIHDLYPLGVFTHQRLNGRLAASGNLAGNVKNMQTRGEIVSGNFQFQTPTTVIHSENALVKWDVDGISRTSILETLKGTLEVRAQQAKINELGMSNLALGMDLKGGDGEYSFAALIDSAAQVNFSGQLGYRGGLYHFDMPEFKVGVGSLLYENADPINIAMGTDGLLVKSLFMRHEAEELSFSGYFNPVGVSDLEVTAKGFLVNNLRQLVKPSKIPEAVRGVGGILSGRFLLRGTFEHPNLSLDAIVDGVRIGETVFGQVESRFSFFEHALTLFVSYRSNPLDPGLTPDMLFSGTVPYELPLGGGHTHRPEGTVDLTLQSKGMRLDLFSPFIPVISNLTGFLTCDLKIKGSTDDPEYSGYISLSSAQFLFKPLNIQYILDGRFVSEKKRIALHEVTLKNFPQDQTYGRGLLNLSGDFTLDGLRLGEFDLLAKGQLLLMKEITRLPGSKFYGDLFASTGPSGLKWTGKPSKSLLMGEVFVRNGKLTLPPERETIFLDTKNIAILFRDDTSKVKPEERSEVERNESARPLLALNSPSVPLNGVSTARKEPSPLQADRNENQAESTSFLDNIVYDIIIEAQGPTQLRFIFNPVTNEELFADLKGRLAFEKTGPQARLSGDVQVGSRSYYNYFKRFEATGKLQFTGDPLNPELSITGKYEGVHRSISVSIDSVQADEKVLVTLDISGTRNEPKLKFDLQVERNGKYEKPSSGDTESDAIAFLLSGQFRDELTSARRQALIGENLIGLTSGVLSAPLREYIRKETGVSLDVLYYGGASFQQSADVRLSGEIGDAVVRFGGRVLDNIGNTNVSVELPMGSILGTESWRNLILTLERRVEGLESVVDSRTSNGARLLYRINF